MTFSYAHEHCVIRKWARWLVVALLPLAFSSCVGKSLMRMISSEEARLQSASESLGGEQREEVELSWASAHSIMLKRNLSLSSSQSRVDEIKRKRKNQWREWLPRPSVYFGLQSSLRNVGDLSSDDFSQTFYAPISIPNPVTQRARAYNYALSEVQAEDAHEMMKRRMVIALYKLFKEWEFMNNQFHFKEPVENLEDEIYGMMAQFEQGMFEREKTDRFWEQFARMLNRPGVNIVPRVDTVPDIDYQDRLDQLEPGRNYAKIAYRLSSYEIVASLLRARGIKISQWPQSRINAGFPPIYDSNRDGDEWFSEPGQISLFGSVSKSFDMTGDRAASLRSAEEQVDFIRQQLKIRMDAEDREWRRLKERYRGVLAREKLLRARLSRELRMEGGDVRRNWESVKSLFKQLQNVERSKLGLDMELWLWDDAAWK